MNDTPKLSASEREELSTFISPEKVEELKALARTLSKRMKLGGKHTQQTILTRELYEKRKQASISRKKQIKRKKAKDRRK